MSRTETFEGARGPRPDQGGLASFEALAETGPGLVFVQDPYQVPPRFIYVAPQAQEILGHPASALMEDPTLWLRSVHPDDRARVKAQVDEAIANERELELNFRMVRPDGCVRRVHSYSKVVRDDDGRMRARQGVLFDMTELHDAYDRIADMEAKYRLLVEHMPVATYVDEGYDPLVSRYVSPQFVELTGYSEQEWNEHPDYWPAIIHEDDRPAVIEAWKLMPLSLGTSWSQVYRIVRPDGDIRWVHDVAQVRFRDNVPVFEGAFHDITELKILEQTLTEANERLRAADESRERFFVTASHELRTPITALLGFADVLERGWDDLSDEEKLDHIGTIKQQGHRLARLVGDLLAAADLDRHVLSAGRRDIGLRRALDSAVRASVGNPFDVDVRVDGGLEVSCDPDALRLILENLISNAERYGSPPVVVTATASDQEVEVRIADAGPGVPDDLRDHLFERFAMSQTMERRVQQGFALGLAVARELARANGGDLTYEGDPSGGAVFVLTLAPASLTADDQPRWVDWRLR
jgi:PAS domain S-box-containing protein